MYKDEMRNKVIRDYLCGMRKSGLVKKYGVGRATLDDWLKSCHLSDIDGNEFKLVDVKQIIKDKEIAEAKFKILIEAHCFPDASLKEREKAIEYFEGQYTVYFLCKVFQVNKGTYYNYHLRRAKKTESQKLDELLTPLIKEIVGRSNQCFGPKKIHYKLLEKGYHCSENRIKKIMKEEGLRCEICKKQILYPKTTKNKYLHDRLHRNFVIDSPNKVWLSDITYVRVDGNFFFICAVMDLFSRKIVGWRVGCQIVKNLVIGAFKDAFNSRGEPEGLIFHSDRGTQYIAESFRDLLKSLGVVQSFSNTGCPYDNAVMESFFGILKSEETKRHQYQTYRELKLAIEKFIDYYNTYRTIENLDYHSPDQYEQLYCSTKKEN